MQDRMQEDHIVLGITMLKFVGEFTSYKYKLPINIYRFSNFLLMILNVILLFANLPNADGYMYVQIIGYIGAFCHGLLRYCCILYYNPEIYSLLNDMERFWNINHNTNRMGKTQHLFLTATPKIMASLAVVAMIMYSLKPLAAKDALIFPCRIIFDSVGFEAALLFSQYYLVIIIATIVSGYDVIYIWYSAHVIIQMGMLKYGFEHITRDTDLETIYSYIRHHQLMLKIFDRMNYVYFWMFFFAYGLALVAGCSQLYMIILEDTKISDLLRSAVYMVCLSVEFALYTSIAEQVASQFTDVAYSIYNSQWYERTLEDRKVLLLVMMKGQRQRYFSAGGVVEINVDALGSVIRKVFSFCAVLKNLLND